MRITFALSGKKAAASRRLMLPAVVVAVYGAAFPAFGQSMPQSYGQYYGSHVAKTPNMISPTHYLYNKYFYHSPSVSPYINLDRRGSQAGDAYATWVQPELGRRQRSASAAWSQSNRPNSAANNYGLATGGRPSQRPKQATAPSPYYQQYYRQPGRR